MGLFNKDLINAVAEGTRNGEIGDLHFKVMRLDVEEETTVLNDFISRYPLYGRIKDNGKVERLEGYLNKEQIIDFIGFRDGILVPYSVMFSTLKEVRSVFLRDGRIFVNREVDEGYHRKIQFVSDIARNILDSQETKEIYRYFVEGF